METAFDRTPDAEVTFRFNGTRRTPAADGYRPTHRIRENYLTTGVHHYFDVTEVAPDGEARGTITFLTPEAYPNTLWVGKTIDICEGERIVGTATVEKVLNPILVKKLNTSLRGARQGDVAISESEIGASLVLRDCHGPTALAMTCYSIPC